MSQNVDLIQRYYSALAKSDFETVSSLAWRGIGDYSIPFH